MSERYVGLAEVRDMLAAESGKRELSGQQRAALDHAQAIARLSAEDSTRLADEINGLDFTTDFISYKVADLLPRYPEDVRAIFAKERINLEAANIQQIIDIVGKYL